MNIRSENEGLRHELRSISSDLDTFIREIISKFDEIKKRVENVQSKINQQSTGQNNKPNKAKPNQPKYSLQESKTASKTKSKFQLNKFQQQQALLLNLNPNPQAQSNDEFDFDGLEFTEKDLQDLRMLAADVSCNDLDLELNCVKYQQDSSLFQRFRQLQAERIKKADPNETPQLIDEFIQRKWDCLTPREREAEVAKNIKKKEMELQKIQKKQQQIEHKKNVKQKFSHFLIKKSKRQVFVNNPPDIKKEELNQPKVFASDLRAILESSKVVDESKNAALSEKLKRIFQS